MAQERKALPWGQSLGPPAHRGTFSSPESIPSFLLEHLPETLDPGHRIAWVKIQGMVCELWLSLLQSHPCHFFVGPPTFPDGT